MGAAEVAGEGAGEQAHLEQVHGTGGGGLVLPTTTPGTPSRSAAAAAAFNNFACAAALALGQVEAGSLPSRGGRSCRTGGATASVPLRTLNESSTLPTPDARPLECFVDYCF